MQHTTGFYVKITWVLFFCGASRYLIWPLWNVEQSSCNFPRVSNLCSVCITANKTKLTYQILNQTLTCGGCYVSPACIVSFNFKISAFCPQGFLCAILMIFVLPAIISPSVFYHSSRTVVVYYDYIQDVSEGKVNILGGGSMDYSE